MRVFLEFHTNGIINQNTNATFIALVPKKSQTFKISDFKPISLVTSLYKIIAKVLSGHLRKVLHETIFGSQGAFVEERHILDVVLIVNEVVDKKRRSGEEGVVFKIDFEKAYDHMNWGFLDHVFGRGLPLGGNPKTIGFWDPVVERISRRLDGWKKAFLSLRGRITLIQSSLSHIPSYFLSLFKIPVSIVSEIGKLQRDFLWSRAGEGKKDHLIKWDVVCKPKELGGLGFGKTSLRNIALLRKWLWRFPKERSGLWHKVIASIYGTHPNGWDANMVVRWSHKCPWKAIAQVFQDFSPFVRLVVGNGKRIRFWEDLWSGNQTLCSQFAGLYRVISVKNLTVSNVLSNSFPLSWNFNFRRNLTDTEIDLLQRIMSSLSSVFFSPSLADSRDWSLLSSGPIMGPKEARRAGGLGLANGSLGLKLKGVATREDGPKIGPSSRRWAEEVGCHASSKGPVTSKDQASSKGPIISMGCQKLIELEGKVRVGPVSTAAQASSNDSQEKGYLLEGITSINGNSSETKPFVAWESKDLRKQQTFASYSVTNRALEEEALRYGSGFCSRGERALGASHLIPFHFDMAPEGEFYDRSGDIEEEIRVDKTLWLTVYEGYKEKVNGCRDSGETKRSSDKVKETEGAFGTPEIQVVRNEPEEKWEESSLAKFSHFLGFPTEGLEKEILSFFIKIRKRREKIHSKKLLEKSKFERELKRLECSVNYEGGRDKNSIYVGGYCEKFRLWEIFRLESSECGGGFGRNSNLLGQEVFTGVYGLFSKVERDELWEKFGAIRGRWEDPWAGGSSFTGGEFTWNGGHNNQAGARLDRFLVSPSWLDQFHGVTQSRLPRPISDHFPIILVGGGIRRGPTPFRFENMWLKVEGFKDLIHSWWQGIEVRGSANFRLAANMKEIKQKLKVWNREVFWRLDCNKSSALQRVDFWDWMESERSLTMEKTELKKEAKENYKKCVLLEETHGRQLSREIWLREGDRNTGFFHRMASAHQDTGWKADIGRLQLDQISQQEEENLESLFTENEVHTALMEMNGDKAPGPDGFTMAFDKVKSGAEDLGDFRPISLLGGLYKLLAKVLANRLKKVVGKVVSTSQNAFVMGRQILDASLIANEVIDSWQKRKENGLICKLDIEKAYDSINWSTKGLRQGDPLSPYLFVMGMEVLDAFIRRAMEGGFLSGSASGLRINLTKSEVIPVGEVEEIEELVVELGCRVGSLPSQYLGLPLGFLIELLICGKGWKREMPNIVARRLEKVQRDFLWRGGNLEGKIHLVNWEVVCTDKEKGGLGLRKLVMLNKALIGKWIWRYACDKDNLWKQVITVKYGQEGLGWRPKKANGAVGVRVWKEIWKESDWCWDNMIFRAGKGTKIRFWTDV
ncbi:putative ribonuclease H protein [Vitis vinifera]|uniref:Putative ribonuclease H protein n=1 Tax=Vitis vinifera TaxID=29760 RepID=A0A438I6I0_VITVI|nr:putative ribonuclease H protein [Vitis vinifera]